MVKGYAKIHETKVFHLCLYHNLQKFPLTLFKTTHLPRLVSGLQMSRTLSFPDQTNNKFIWTWEYKIWATLSFCVILAVCLPLFFCPGWSLNCTLRSMIRSFLGGFLLSLDTISAQVTGKSLYHFVFDLKSCKDLQRHFSYGCIFPDWRIRENLKSKWSFYHLKFCQSSPSSQRLLFW